MGIKFIHTADLHLGSNLHLKFDQDISYKNKFGNPVLDSFKKITRTAIEENVDFIIISGDLFDSDERSVNALKVFNSEAEKLKNEDIPIYLIAGNHDPLNNFNQIFTLNSNVKIFTSENDEIKEYKKNNKLKARLIGQSYRGNSDSRKMYSSYNPPDKGVFNIALLHTQLDPNNYNYVPCSIDELKENKKIDYWALGHIHQNEIINDKNPVITYPGIPQGRDFGEKDKKGFYLVELTQNNDPKLDFIYSSKYIWKEVDITIDEKNQIKTIDEILDHILLKIKELFNQDDFNYIVRWNLDIYSRHISKIKQKNEEIEDYIVNELNRKNNKQNFVWSEDCNLNFYRRIPDKSELAKKDKLFFDIIDFKEKITNDEDLLLELKEKLGDIWQGQSDLENIDEYRFDYNKEIEEILENAENEILKKLWEERGE